MAFSEEAFLAQKPGAPLQAFHRRAVHLQLFKQVRQNPGGGAGGRGRARAGAENPGSLGATPRVGPAESYPSRSPGGGGTTELLFP